MMRKWLVLLAGVLALLLINHAILDKEQLLREGRIILLPLAPVDPRSLMQGDYMQLRYEMERDVLERLDREQAPQQDGFLLVKVEGNGVARLQQVLRERPAPVTPELAVLRFRVRDGLLKIAGNTFFFEEGKAAVFQQARFGEFRLDENGELLLTGLRDGGMRALEP
jgi:uncharacterized membrane-anchored protein